MLSKSPVTLYGPFHWLASPTQTVEHGQVIAEQVPRPSSPQAVPPVRGKRGRPRRRSDVVLGDRGYDHDKYRWLVWASE